MKRILVIGAGMVGTAIAADLASQFKVVVADKSRKALDKIAKRFPVDTCELDVANEALMIDLLAPFDLVVSAVPGFLGFNTLRTIILAGKDVVDISFFPEDPFLLDDLARQKNVIAVVDCGVAPGLCNIIAGYHSTAMKLESYECLVGGLPVERKYPHEYKAVFSPADVIEEYTRPARYVEGNQLVIKPALTDIVRVDFTGIGTLESFNTDGLRTLAITLNGVPDMKEKTLRYPGHAEFMQKLQACGLFSKDKLTVGGSEVIPFDVTSALLFNQWKYEGGEADFTIMRVTLTGSERGVHTKYTYHLLDRFDPKSGMSAMSRTTGYTCTSVVQLVAGGIYSEKGISPPEYIGMDERRFSSIEEYLAMRNIVLVKEKSTEKEPVSKYAFT